jgi:hypothetical protein
VVTDSGNHAKIHVRRQPAVQRNLCATGRSPPRERRKIEIGKPYWLFELVDAVAGHKNPRHMGLARDDCFGRRDVAVGTAEIINLAGEGGYVVFGVRAFVLPVEHASSMTNRTLPRLDTDQQFIRFGSVA